MWALLPTCLPRGHGLVLHIRIAPIVPASPNTGARNAIARGEELFDYTNIDIIDVAG